MSASRGAGLLAWALVCALAFLPPILTSGAGPERGRRLLHGPLDDLAADLAWVRFQRARQAGDVGRALLHASTALEARPDDLRGWHLVLGYIGYELASPALEPDPGRRRRWARAALERAREAEERVDDPARLALFAALLARSKAELDPVVGDPGGDPARGREALLRRAREELARARALGSAESAAGRAAGPGG